MHIGVLGINHKSADLALREEICKICTHCFGKENGKKHAPVVLLSTCNRSELYFSSEDLATSHSYFLNILRNEFASPFEHKIYSYFGTDCFFHLATVTAGLDSAIIGESEIQGQVKNAYQEALCHQTLPPELHFLFQKCLKIGKEVRSKLSCYHMMPTLEEAIFSAGFHLLGSLFDKKILLVGLSEINLKIYKTFKKKNLNLTWCNRTLEKIKDIINDEKSRYLLWEEFDRWREYDMIIFGTRSAHYLLSSEWAHVSFSSLRLIIDLSVPRNVDPKVGRNPSLKLLNVDQLMRGIDRKQKIRAEEIARHEKGLISELVTRQINFFASKDVRHLQLA